MILNQYQSIFAYDSFQNALSQLLACIGVEPKNSVIGNIELANHNKNYNKEESQLIEQKGKQPNNHNGHEYVDLGLPSGLKWATCNVGAEMPTDFGDFFAWGETSPDSFPSWWYDKYGQKTTSKYNNEDKRKKLESSDDAASMNWGDGWRMPTLDDVKELVEFCEWKSQNDYNSSGIAGYLGTSKKNGNTIFLPAAGCIYGGSHLAEGKVGFYWTSLLYDIESAHLFFFNYNYNDGFKYKIDSRSMGRSVRAVLDVR
ncbi:MAG: hypothetical protein MJZ33_13420 [Paludibacteraceae bacterium]|nr:hypothetical protein [Paludibacteraceae bacterium]